MANLSSPVRHGAEPIHLGDGRVGVALCHGFTGSPHSLRGWAQDLADAGFSVEVPRLPGHGTHWRDLAQTPWTAWVRELEAAVDRLSRSHDKVFLGGLSMGAAVALRVAQLRPKVAGLMLVNPAIAHQDWRLKYAGLLRHVKPTVPGITNDIARRKEGHPTPDELGYDTTPLRGLAQMTLLWKETRAALGAIDQPVLIFRSQTDHVVDDASLPVVLNGIASTDVSLTLLHRSYHVATMDYDAPLISSTSVDWLRSHV